MSVLCFVAKSVDLVWKYILQVIDVVLPDVFFDKVEPLKILRGKLLADVSNDKVGLKIMRIRMSC